MEVVIYYTITLILFLHVFFLWRKRGRERLPPGSLGIPLIGQSLGILKAMRANKGEEWLQERIRKYGPISKLGLFGYPTVFLHGQAANKFIYTCDGNLLSSNQPSSFSRIIGERNIVELSGDDHKRVRGALLSFLKPEVLKKYVAKIDEETKNHLKMNWQGKQEVKVEPLMKILTFDVICSLIFGIESGAKRDELIELFEDMIAGVLSIPVNLPCTQFRRSLEARARLNCVLMDLICERRLALEEERAFPDQDLITCLLSIRNEDNSNLMSDEEIMDNITFVMGAGYDTTSILLTFLVRLLAENTAVYAAIVHEQEEIAKSKPSEEFLTWDDLAKMKYTWMVAKETLRMTPPVFLNFRRALQDIEYGGYAIPKGWQVMWASTFTHMDSNIFPDPSKFDPSRFAQRSSAAPGFSYVAFGGGARICPGYEFARMETLVMIHYLVTRFTWKLSLKDNSFARNPMPVFNQGLPIQIKPRND